MTCRPMPVHDAKLILPGRASLPRSARRRREGEWMGEEGRGAARSLLSPVTGRPHDDDGEIKKEKLAAVQAFSVRLSWAFQPFSCIHDFHSFGCIWHVVLPPPPAAHR